VPQCPIAGDAKVANKSKTKQQCKLTTMVYGSASLLFMPFDNLSHIVSQVKIAQ